MVKKFAEEAKDVNVIKETGKHLDPNCQGNFVEEVPNSWHCALCGAWEYR